MGDALATAFCGVDDQGEAIGWGDACDFPFDAFCAADVETMLAVADDSDAFGRDALDDMNDFLATYLVEDEPTDVDFLFAMCGEYSDDVSTLYEDILAVLVLALADETSFPRTVECSTSLAAGVAGAVDAVTGIAGLPGYPACDPSDATHVAGFTCSSAADIAALDSLLAAGAGAGEDDGEEEECDEDDEDAECEEEEDASQTFALGFSVLAVLASL